MRGLITDVARNTWTYIELSSGVQPHDHERTRYGRSQGAFGVIHQEGRHLGETLSPCIFFATVLTVPMDGQANSVKRQPELHD